MSDDLDRACRKMAATCACFHLRRAARAVTLRYDRVLAPSGLKATHLTLLSAIALRAGANLADLADVLVVEPSALSRNVALLKRRRLVKTTVGDDKRARMVALTDLGRAALARALPLWTAAQAEIEAGLARELRATLAMLDDVTRAALPALPAARRA
jgi:DNA-binding MarR family transcriptional regulator